MVDGVGFFYEPTLCYTRPPYPFANRRMRHQRTTADPAQTQLEKKDVREYNKEVEGRVP